MAKNDQAIMSYLPQGNWVSSIEPTPIVIQNLLLVVACCCHLFTEREGRHHAAQGEWLGLLTQGESEEKGPPAWE